MEECFVIPHIENYDDIQHDDTCATDETEPHITIHPVVDLPIPYGIESKSNEIIFLDPAIGEGRRLVNEKTTSIPYLFSLIRQFIQPVCHNLGFIVDEMLKRGIRINDIDATTGMSILHYAVRATALSEKRGLVVVKRLLSNGADPRQRCLFSGMNALHIAVYFDIASVVKLLLKPCDKWPSVDVNSLCDGFEFGTSLHIAASCLSSKVIEILLQKGAKPLMLDDLDRTPIACLPTNFNSADEHRRAKHIKDTLSKYVCVDDLSGGPLDQASNLTIGSKVVVTLNDKDQHHNSRVVKKTGTLRYIGKLPKSSDDWAGVELDISEGQNSGEIGKKVYFKCKKNHGVFVRLSMIHPQYDHKKGLRMTKKESSRRSAKCLFKVGNRVLVAGTMEGVVRFVGETQFATGTWCGVELDSAGPGRNNGSVGDVSYFTCPPSKGVFSPPSKLQLISDFVSADDFPESFSESKPSPRPKSEGGSKKLLSSSRASYPLTTRSRRLRFEDPVDSSLHSNLSTAKADHSYLHTGMRVDICGTDKSGIIKFVGETEFASGLWVGLDLGTPHGRNDGSVQGRRYFKCAPLHGLMVRPHRLAYNGVSGSALLPSDVKSHRSTRR